MGSYTTLFDQQSYATKSFRNFKTTNAFICSPAKEIYHEQF